MPGIKSFDSKPAYICPDRYRLSKGRFNPYLYTHQQEIEIGTQSVSNGAKNVLSVGKLRDLKYIFKRKVSVVPTHHGMRLKTRKAFLILSVDLSVTFWLSLVQFLRSRMVVPALVDPPLGGCSTSSANHQRARMGQADCS